MQNHLMQDIVYLCPYEKTCSHKTKKCKVIPMNIVSKVLIPNKEWILEDSGKKIGSIAKNKKGYTFLRKGQAINIKNYKDIVDKLDVVSNHKFEIEPLTHFIYDYPCSSKPHGSVYDVKKKLPLFAKSSKSKSQYCAGYYIIQFRKGWVKSFCPKLITIDRNPYRGPFKTEAAMKAALASVNKA